MTTWKKGAPSIYIGQSDPKPMEHISHVGILGINVMVMRQVEKVITESEKR